MESDALARLRNSVKPDVEDRFLPHQVFNATEPPHKEKDLNKTSNFTVKQSTLRLEVQLRSRLVQVSRDHDISRDVLVESLFCYFESHKTIQNKILTDARRREDFRRSVANHRRAKTMIDKFELKNDEY